MYHIIINIHVFLSTVCLIISIVLIYSLLQGLRKQAKYNRYFLHMENAFILLLYSGLILGIILYFFLDSDKLKLINYIQAEKNMNLRFWAVEHFSFMLIALFFAQIGKIFTIKPIGDTFKFKYALFYYGVATFTSYLSTGLYLINKLL